MPARKILISVLLTLTTGQILAADQAPIGVAPVTLSDTPYMFDTAEQHGIKVTLLAKGLPRSFSMAFLPNGDMLVSERGGNLRIIHDATGVKPMLDPNPVPGIPQLSNPYRNGGLGDLALHPDFARNHWLYFTYNKAGPAPAEGQRQRSMVSLMRGRYENGRVNDVEELFTGELGGTSGSRIVFAKDGTIYMTTGGPGGAVSQDLDSVYGKILRLNDDGSTPADNPYIGQDDKNPAVFSFGHRDQLGLAMDPASGAILATDHGPNGGDEVNIILPGRNYGWPDFTYGRNYDGSRLSDLPVTAGIEQPQILWVPSIGITGITIYTGDNFPAWKGNLFVGSVQYGETARTGALERVVLNDNLEDIRREKLLSDLHQRIRDVRQGPDDNLYVLTDGDEFAVLRISPN